MNRILKFLVLIFVSTFSNNMNAEIYVVAVGISKYQNISDLVLPENDAKTIAKLYKTRTKKVITMTGRYATRANIVKAMNDQFKRAKKGDMVIFFFSGHGYGGGFCPYDMGKKYQNALSYEDIYAIFRRSKATRKVIMADACMAGGLRTDSQSSNNIHSSNSEVLLFLSSRSNEYSIEKPQMTNGFFTAYLNRGLRGGADYDRNKIITAKEIYTFVSDGVKQISHNRQHPVMWGNFDNNFIMVDWR